MELESLKYAWKSLDTRSQARIMRTDPLRQEEQIRAILRRKSRGPIARLRRNLLLESVGVVCLYTPVIAYYLFRLGGRLAVISWFLLIMAALSGVYYYRMNRMLEKMQCPAFQVRSHLERQVRSLEKYIRADLLMGTLLIPVTACLLGILLYWKLPVPLHPGILYVSAGNPLWKVIALWVTTLLLLGGIMYFINRRFIRSFYGRHITRLREILEEIREG